MLCDSDDIPKSPFIAQICQRGNFRPDLVQCNGAGIKAHGVILGIETEFMIDTSKAGIAPLQINVSIHFFTISHFYLFHYYKVQDSIGNPVSIVTSSKDINMIHCTYTPQSTLAHTIEINYGSVAAAGSPYRVYVSTLPDLSKIAVSGEWFDVKPKLNNRTGFQINTRSSGECAAALEVKIVHEESSQVVPIDIKHDNKVVHIEFTPTKAGNYSTIVHYDGIVLPQSRSIYVPPIVDFSKITISGLDSELNFVGQLNQFAIDFKDMNVNLHCDLLAVNITEPSGNTFPSKLTMNINQNIFQISFTPRHAGCHRISILYDNVPIIGAPFNINVKNQCKPENCKAIGDGLISGITGIMTGFDIKTREAGSGELTLAIEGPAETKLKCIDNKNGSCSVQYVPIEPGDYEISIFFANTHIPGSPFKVSVTSPVRPDLVRIFGPAIENRQLIGAEATFFNIDVSEAGPGLIAVAMNNAHGVPVDNVMVLNKGGGLYTVNFITPAENVIVDVKFAHQNVAARYFCH